MASYFSNLICALFYFHRPVSSAKKKNIHPIFICKFLPHVCQSLCALYLMTLFEVEILQVNVYLGLLAGSNSETRWPSLPIL